MVSDICEISATEMLFSAAQEVFASMLGSELTRLDDDADRVSPFDGVVSFVGLTGEYTGTGFIICDSPIACDIASRFLMTPFEGANEDVLDAVGEVTNMIIGNFKTWIESQLGPLQMSTPTVVHGKNISTHSVKSDLTTTVQCSYAAGGILIKLCLAKATPAARNPVGPACALCGGQLPGK